MQDFDVFMIIDTDGNHAVGVTQEAAEEAYGNDVGDLGCCAYRVVRVPVRASLPKIVEVPAVVVPDED